MLFKAIVTIYLRILVVFRRPSIRHLPTLYHLCGQTSSAWCPRLIAVGIFCNRFLYYNFTHMNPSVLTLRAFMKRRAQFSQFLSSTTSLSLERYFRLMCLATTDIFLTVPISSFGLYLNAVSKPIYPWVSWSDTHFEFSVLDVVPAAIWRRSTLSTVVLESSRWLLVLCALVFFGFFGFADEARKNYRRAYWAVASRFGAVPPSKKNRSG